MTRYSSFVFLLVASNAFGVLSAVSKYPIPDWKTPVVSNDLQSHTWDFDFGEHQNISPENSPVKPYSGWTENDLCKNLQCKPHQMCMVEDDDVAICISKRKFQSKKISKPLFANNNKIKMPEVTNDNEDELTWEKTEENERPVKPKEETPCIPCPVVKPDFVCGSDNHTYSSICRMEFRNCMHKVSVSVTCKGFCPCKEIKTQIDFVKESQIKDRWNRYMTKYENTVAKHNALQKPLKKQIYPWKNEKPVISTASSTSINVESTNTDYTDALKKSVVHEEIPVTPVTQKGCTDEELRAMGDRLLEWFSVVRTDHHRGQSRRRSFRLSHTQLPDCKPEVGWMFQHLDTDGDLKLSLQELYDLKNDDQEHCLRPYLLDCDVERDLSLSPTEWCTCFDKSLRKCAVKYKVVQGINGGVIPRCDKDGFFLPIQCYKDYCWCVDKQYGAEIAGTRRKGQQPDCSIGGIRDPYVPEIDDQEDNSSSEEQEGSADHPLVF